MSKFNYTFGLLLGLLTLSLSTLTMANNTPAIQKCYDKANDAKSTQHCAQKNYRYLNADINKTYRQLKSKLSKSKRDQLIQVQQSWLKYRDGDCQFAKLDYAGKPLGSLIQLECKNELMKQRLRHLTEYLMQVS